MNDDVDPEIDPIVGAGIGVHSAASCGDTESLLQMLKNNNKLANKVNQFGMTPLHGAAFHGNIQVVNILLSHGANPNHPSSGPKYTFPLHLATIRLHRPIIEALLIQGDADPAAKDYLGHTALDIAQSISVETDSVAKDPYTNIQMMDFINECIQKSPNFNNKILPVKSFTFESRNKKSTNVLPKVSICESVSDAGDYENATDALPETKSPLLRHFVKSDIF